MTLEQLVAAIRARWIIVALALFSCLAAGVAWVGLRAPLYTVQASVMLDVRTADPVGGAAIPALGISNYIATQADLIRSARVLQRVVRERGIDQDRLAAQAWREQTGGQGDRLAWLGDAMSRALTVRPSRESNLIELTYTDTDPVRAAATLKAILDAYIQTTIDLRIDAARRNSSFFEDHVRQHRQALSEAQQRLSDQQREAGMVATDERLDVENTRLIELSNQLLSLQMAAGDSGSRARLGTPQIGETQEALSSPLITQLSADISRQEARIGELAQRLGDQHPELLQARALVASQRQRLDEEMRRLGKSLGVTNKVHLARVEQVRADYEAQRKKVAALKAQRDLTAVLQRDVENANQAYSALVARAQQSGLESTAALSNASVVREPAVPVAPSQPRVLLTLVLCGLGGLVLGLAGALLRELGDRRLRLGDDVTLLLGQTLLGTLPHDRGSRVTRAQPAPGLARLFSPGQPGTR